MRYRMIVFVGVASVLSAGVAYADNSACLSSAGDWKATGSIEATMTISAMMQSYAIDFAAPVVAERTVKPTPMNPAAKGDCMVKSAGGLGPLPEGCKKGGTATATGRLSFDSKGLGIVNIARAADVTCQ